MLGNKRAFYDFLNYDVTANAFTHVDLPVF